MDTDRKSTVIQFGRVSMTIFSRFMKDESGATAIEYGLIAAIVGVGIIAVLKNVRTGLQSTFNTVNSELGNASTP
jgi:pilus assembly protein Flp/PilA